MQWSVEMDDLFEFKRVIKNSEQEQLTKRFVLIVGTFSIRKKK